MTDKYVYFFLRPSGPAGAEILSQRRATLDSIKDGKGEAVMESQMVVDHREVDDKGFEIGGSGNASQPTDERWSQIRSLELRANSRDTDAQELNEHSQGASKYMLQLESRELRHQASGLKAQLDGAMTDDHEDSSDTQNFAGFAAGTPTDRYGCLGALPGRDAIARGIGHRAEEDQARNKEPFGASRPFRNGYVRRQRLKRRNPGWFENRDRRQRQDGRKVIQPPANRRLLSSGGRRSLVGHHRHD
jgi:hypothetical protein